MRRAIFLIVLGLVMFVFPVDVGADILMPGGVEALKRYNASVCPENQLMFECFIFASEECKRYRHDSNFELLGEFGNSMKFCAQITTQTLIRYLAIEVFRYRLVVAVVLTVVIELLVWVFLGLRKKISLFLLAVLNIFTVIGANYFIDVFNAEGLVLRVLFLEILIVIVEWLVTRILVKKSIPDRHLLAVVGLSNLVSFGVGVFLVMALAVVN